MPEASDAAERLTSARLSTCSTHASASSSQVLRFSSILPGPAAVCTGTVHCVGRVSTTHSLSCCEAARVPSEMLGLEPAIACAPDLSSSRARKDTSAFSDAVVFSDTHSLEPAVADSAPHTHTNIPLASGPERQDLRQSRPCVASFGRREEHQS